MSETDPDSYSLDDMMRRLQARGRQDLEGRPELVTRADGTQAVRVRKRKRRSYQPHKEAEKRHRRRVLIGVSLGVFFLVAGSLGLMGWFFYLNSGAYQAKVGERIKAFTGAELNWQAFRATPVNAAADFVELSWPESTPVSRVRLVQPRTDLGLLSHLTGTWQGQELKGSTAQLDLRLAGAADDAPPTRGPLRFQMPIRAQSLDIRFGERFTVYHTQAILRVADPSVPDPNLILQGGEFRIPRWGRYTLNYASVGWSDDGVRVGTLQLSPHGEENAEFEIYGDGFEQVDPRGGTSELGLKVREMPGFALMGTGLSALVEGTFETGAADLTSRFVFDPGDLASISMEATVRSVPGSRLRFDRLPMFEVLGSSFDSVRLIQPRYDAESTLRVVRETQRIAVEDLSLIADGLIWIRGEMVESRGARLDGTLRVGVAKSLMVLADSQGVKKVFSEDRDGFRWATVQLGGTTREPTDDLAAQLAAADEAISPASGGDAALEDEFRNLTTPSGD